MKGLLKYIVLAIIGIVCSIFIYCETIPKDNRTPIGFNFKYERKNKNNTVNNNTLTIKVDKDIIKIQINNKNCSFKVKNNYTIDLFLKDINNYINDDMTNEEFARAYSCIIVYLDPINNNEYNKFMNEYNKKFLK